jgi:hypothetical protein
MKRLHQIPAGFRPLRVGTKIKSGDITTKTNNSNPFKGVNKGNGWIYSNFVGWPVLSPNLGMVYYRKKS